MTSFKKQVVERTSMMYVLAVLVLIANTGPVSTAAIKPLSPVVTASARVIRDTGCTAVEDDFYLQYIAGLGNTVYNLIKDYELLYGANEPSLPRLQTMPPAIVVSRNDSRGVLKQLWTSICEVESYIPWLERARDAEPAVSDSVSFIQRLANASVIGLRNHLVDFQSCGVAPHSTPPSASNPPPTGATSPATTTTTGGGTSPEQTTMETVDIALPCALQLELLRPQPQQSAVPYPLPAILDGMLAAVARLDALVKRDFS